MNKREGKEGSADSCGVERYRMTAKALLCLVWVVYEWDVGG